MTNYEKEVLRNIFYAVETGGQKYGCKDYASFTEAETNSENEKAITIGAAQWYGTRAAELLNLIRKTAPDTFNALDTAEIGYDLDTEDWTSYRLSRSSTKAQCIIAIIDSETGHICQDNLMDLDMEVYINDATAAGIEPLDAKMMYANFSHLGGKSAADRVLAKTPHPYTLDGLYNASQSDTDNQVGTYTSRNDMVYAAIKEYITNYKVTPEEAIKAVISVARGEVGYLEKATNAYLDSKKENAGNKNYTKYWRDLDPSLQGSSWCACFVSWVLAKAFGETTARALLAIPVFPYVWVDDMRTYRGSELDTTPKPGDLVVYWSNSESRYYHVGIVVATEGENFTTIEGNTNPMAGVENEGEGVYEKNYSVHNERQPRFVHLNYSLVNSINSGGIGENPFPSEDSFKATGIAYCTGNGVRIRATPNGTILGALYNGDSFEVDGVISGEWVHVKVAGIGIGYMHKDYVSYVHETSPVWKKTGIATCTANGVYVRKTPGGSIIGQLYKQDQFEIDGTQSGDWVHIKVSGIGIGYMHKDYVSTTTDWIKKGIAYCSGNGVYVRATPGGNILGKLYLNDTFEVDGKRAGSWVHIKAAEIGIGYMHQDYVSYKNSGTDIKSTLIKKAQMALNEIFNLGVDVDGSWGPGSKKTYITSIQIALNRLYGENLETDGSFGPATRNAVASHLLKRGDQNIYVGVLQIGLLAHSYNLSDGVDRSFGPATEQAVINFQSSVGILANGIVGIDTFSHLVL